jgi:hypothetical protein
MEKESKPQPKPALSREERLAAALRENLRRRKAQARARDAADTPAEQDKAQKPDH